MTPFYAHYESGVEKKRLLKEGSHSLEFYQTKQILSKYIPKKPVTILDIGGGPGQYSFWLASIGHHVHLVDIVPLHVRQAQETQRRSKTQLTSVTLGDARFLDFDSRTAAYVLMFGPLCHLVQRKERLRALSEAYRVLRPRGWIFAAAISRFTSALDGSLNGFIRDPAFMKIMKQDLKNGQYRNPHNVPQYFTTTFHHPEELQAEIHRAGFNSVKACALTGFAWLLPNLKEYSRNPKLRKRLLTILETLEQEPSMMGVSDHLLVAARKPLA